jgi:hypothetical protein
MLMTWYAQGVGTDGPSATQIGSCSVAIGGGARFQQCWFS